MQISLKEKHKAMTERNTNNNRKTIKYFSLNVRNRIHKKMKKIQKKSRYKRNIFKLLYDQIHSDITDIEKEITTGKNLILPFKFLKKKQIKNEILLNKGTNQINQKEIKIEDCNQNTNTYSYNIPKIQNLKNNSYLTNNTTINTSEKKDYKSSTFLTFSKIRNNNHPKTLNIKTRNRPKLTIVKAITENNNIINDDKSKKNIFSSNEYSNTERNNINNSNKILNNSLCDYKNNTKTNLTRINPEIKTQKRIKCLFISYDEKWYLRNKFIYIKLDKLEIDNNYIQSQIISDQFALINENIKIVTSKYLVDKELINKFNSTNNSNQKLINYLIILFIKYILA